MSEGKRLHKLIVKVQNKIDSLKDKVLSTLQSSTNQNDDDDESDDITSLVRSTILKQGTKKRKILKDGK